MDMEFIGNQQARSKIQQFFSDAQTHHKPLFLLLIGAEGLGKASFVREYMQEVLGQFFSSDFLWLRDCSAGLGKKHTLQVETPSTQKTIDLGVDGIYENRGVRELSSWLQQSSLSGKKVALIENIERMSPAAMNAFLKTAEEPLSQRFIFATLSSEKEVLPTVLSRAVLVHFSPLELEEMRTLFTDQSDLDAQMRDFLLRLSGGKPGSVLRLLGLYSEHREEFQLFLKLFESLLVDGAILEQLGILKKVEEIGLLSLFIDALLLALVELGKYEKAESRTQFKKMKKANISEENLLWYTLLE